MSLLDDLTIDHQAETWALADDPGDEAPLWWPDDRSERDLTFRT